MALRSAARLGRSANLGAICTRTICTTTNPFLPCRRLFPHHVTKPGFRYSIRAIQGATVDPIVPQKDDKEQPEASQNWQVKMLYDGDCPLCMREVIMLKERNDKYDGAIKFVDISSLDYSPEDNQGLDYTTAMGRIHAILSDGTIVRDVEETRQMKAIELYLGNDESRAMKSTRKK